MKIVNILHIQNTIFTLSTAVLVINTPPPHPTYDCVNPHNVTVLYQGESLAVIRICTKCDELYFPGSYVGCGRYELF